jgi:outer membrane protein insertion porin family
MKRLGSYLLLLAAVFFVGSCNTTKYLKTGEQLYTGAKVNVESPDRVNEKEIRKSLEKVAYPKPNQKILGIRFKLWFYYKAGVDPKSKFKKWLKYEAGEKPVLYESQIPVNVSDLW